MVMELFNGEEEFGKWDANQNSLRELYKARIVEIESSITFSGTCFV